MSQDNVITPRKNPIKRIVKRNNLISDTKVKNLYYFTDRILKVAHDITIDIRHKNHANSETTTVSKFNIIGFDVIHINKKMEEMANIYATLTNQYNFIYQLSFSAIFNKFEEDGKIISQNELHITLSITQNITQSERDSIIFQWNLQNRIQGIETQESGWNFLRINSIKLLFYKTGEIFGS